MILRLAAAAIAATLSAAPVHADPHPADDTTLSITRIQHVVPGSPRLLVTLSSGKVDLLTPCRYGDGRHCYWDATVRNNGRGRSFLVTRGIVFFHDIP